MDRTKEINTYLKRFKNEWLIKKIKECWSREEPGLINISKTILSEFNKIQTEDSTHSLTYFSLFHLKSSIWTGTYRYRICASDASLYLDSRMIHKDWVPEHLYSDAKDLKDSVTEELKKKFVRLTLYEISSATKSLLEEYQRIAEVYWIRASEMLVRSEEFQSVQKQNDWKILYGTYIDDMKIVLQAENRR